MPVCLGMGTAGWSMIGLSLLVLAFAVWAVVRLFPAAPAADPAAVLDARLASGDLDVETYRTLRAELAHRVPAP